MGRGEGGEGRGREKGEGGRGKGKGEWDAYTVQGDWRPWTSVYVQIRSNARSVNGHLVNQRP